MVISYKSNFLSQIQMTPPEPIKRVCLIIETEPEVRINLEKNYSKNYPAIAKNAMKNFLSPSEQVTSQSKSSIV